MAAAVALLESHNTLQGLCRGRDQRRDGAASTAVIKEETVTSQSAF
jgi:hypothetical protein